MPQSPPRQPGPGGYGTASEFGSLDGWSLADGQAYLGSHPELRRLAITHNGYQHYQFIDGSEVAIRPNGQVMRLPEPQYDNMGKRKNYLRLNIYTGAVIPSVAWHNLPRSEQEWAVI